MPRKPKTTEPDAMPAEAAFAQEAPRGSKTAAIRAALKAHPKKLPKEIAELLNAEGWDVKPQSISVVKSAMKAKKKKAKNAAAAPASEAAGPVVPKDAVSVGLLVKAKKLVQELGGVKEAKTALNALAQLMD